MVENSKKSEPVDLKELVMESLDDIKAVDVVCIDVRDKTELTDYMIVVSGTSNRHVKSIANNGGPTRFIEPVRSNTRLGHQVHGLRAHLKFDVQT